MSTRSLTANAIEATPNEKDNKEDISQEYEKLNEKCDTVITKIKKRKQKQSDKIH